MARRSPARRRPFPRIRIFGRWYNMGPQTVDGVSGVPIPLRETVEQRGVRVARDYTYGTRDRDKSY